MVHEHAIGKIVDILPDGTAVIMAALPNLNHALTRQYLDVEIILPDGRRITASPLWLTKRAAVPHKNILNSPRRL